MISFLRNIRQQLAAQNKVAAYMRYATGEILLVVIGILIALQLNNWNEQRKNNEQFNAVLEQIYTIIDQDVQEMSNYGNSLVQQSDIIDSLIHYPEKIDPTLLPSLLYYTDVIPNEFTSEAAHQLDLLEFNPKNLSQSRLYKSIASYAFNNLEFVNFSTRRIAGLLKPFNFPEPTLIFGYSTLNNYQNINRSLFTEAQQEKILELINTILFKTALQSAKNQSQLAMVLVQNKKADAFSILGLIKQYYPKARLLYQNIGIVGNATPNKNWTENIPMTLTDEQQSIWETTIMLGDGEIKFRDGNSWLANWGGETFPNGNSLWFGSNIKVKKGYYKITLNLTEKTYRIELINE